MTIALHVVEPTLRDETGHCTSFVRSLVASDGVGRCAFHLWIRRDAGPLFERERAVTVHRHFGGPFRRLALVKLYRDLLARGERIFVATAGTADLVALSLAARAPIETPGLVSLYVHWYRPTVRKRRFLARVARRHRGLVILCPTESVAGVFEEAGFERVEIIPYPREREPSELGATPFRTLLFAGAARLDKGFDIAVEIVERLHDARSTLPVTVQVSPTHQGRHAPEIARLVARLRSVGYGRIELIDRTLASAEYAALFRGAITVQPYDAREFADRVSGVTLDALGAGSPVIAPAATWIGQQIERFGAGLVVPTGAGADVYASAAERIAREWEEFAERARAAGRALGSEHDARRLLDAILLRTEGGGTRPREERAARRGAPRHADEGGAERTFRRVMRWSSSAPTALIDALRREPDALVERGTILKPGDRCTVVRLEAEGVSCVLKRFNRKDAFHTLTHLLLPTRAMWSWRNAIRVREAGLAAPEPLAVLERRLGAARFESYFLSRFVDGPTLDRYVRDPALGDAALDAIAAEFGRVWRILGELRAGHDDMKAENFLVEPGGRLSLIDLDGLRTGLQRVLFERARRENLRIFMRNWHDRPELASAFLTRLDEVPA